MRIILKPNLQYKIHIRAESRYWPHMSRASTRWTLFHFCLNPLFQDNSDTNMLKAAEVS